MTYKSQSRRYPSVAAAAVVHHRWDATCTAAGSAADVATCLMQGARTFVVTAAGAAATIWTFTHKGRSVSYTVQGGDDAAAVALAVKNLVAAAWPHEISMSRSSATLKMVVLDGSDETPTLSNSGAGTATSVAGAQYTVVSLDTPTLVAVGLAAAIDAFPELTATNSGAQVQATSASDITSAPTFSGTGGVTFGSVAAHAAEDTTGFGIQTVRQITG